VATSTVQYTERQHLEFVLRLHRALAPDPAEPACWSPFSVASALGLLTTGARGATRDELAALLDADGGEAGGLPAWLGAAGELEPVRRGDDPVLAVSNTLWARPDISVDAEFAAELARAGNGAVRDAPFTRSPEVARKLINDDVAETTHGLIPQLVPPGGVGPETVAALVNALYLKTAWVEPFGAAGTRNEPFHAPDGTVDVPMMHLNKRVGYAAASGWQAVALAARGGVQGVVLLPDGDLAEAEPTLRPKTLYRLLGGLGSKQVRLGLPKFRAVLSAELTPALSVLGVREAFGDQADFTGLSTDPLVVSGVLHQAVLSIDEQGLEGAAATAVMARTAAMVAVPPVVITVDRPFLFMVRHTGTGAVHFLARVVRPLTGGRA
jgi:serine protease inhibitor